MAIAFQADQYKWTHNLGFIIAHLDSYIWTSEGKSRSTKSQCLMSAELGYETIQQELLTIKHMLKITKKKNPSLPYWILSHGPNTGCHQKQF